MDYLENNIKAIEKNKPSLHMLLNEDVKERKRAVYENLDRIETKDKKDALVYKKDGVIVKLNSTYYPIEEAKRWAAQYSFLNLQSVVEVFGLGNGYFIRELIKKLKKEDTLLIFEPSQDIFWYCMTHYDLSDILEQEQVFLSIKEINEESFDDILLKYIFWENRKSQYMVSMPQYEKLFEIEYKWFCQRIQVSDERVVMNKNTSVYFGKRIVANLLQNFPYLVEGNLVQDLKKCLPKNVPAIIIAAGPSLKKNIDELRNAKGKAVLFCVDSALRFLEEQEIIPDFSITIDPNKVQWHYCGDMAQHVPLIMKIQANPAISQLHHGKKLFYSSHPFFNALYEQNGIAVTDYESGGSVSTAAFSVCISLGFERIVLVGQDLAYDGIYTHVGERIQTSKLDVSLYEVEGIDGSMVKTREDWRIYLDWFSSAILTCPNADYIDATEGGAKIVGTRILTLREVVEKYCREKIDVRKIIEALSPTLCQQQLDQIEINLQHSLQDITKIKEDAKRAMCLTDEIVTLLEENENESADFLDSMKDREKRSSLIKKLTLDLNRINTQIEEKPIYQLIDTYMTDMLQTDIENLYEVTSDPQKDQIKIYQRGKALYEVIKNAADGLRPMVEDAMVAFLIKKSI